MANPLSRFLFQQPGQVPVQSDVAPGQGLNQQLLLCIPGDRPDPERRCCDHPG